MSGAGKAQIINFNINYVDDRFAKILTKIYSRILFDYAKNMEARASMPIHIILEEAHRYVQNDNDIKIIGYNIFDRIAKEGRKYGVLLGFISQRPSDLSETAVSQCSNFLIFKMMHPKDVGYIRDMVPNITDEIVKRLKILQPGNCVAFGTAFKVPVLIKMNTPSPPPSSDSCDVSANWFNDVNNTSLVQDNSLYPDNNIVGRSIYKGKSPNNYLLFNNEIWRIISRESDGSLKIVKNESIGNMAFDTDGGNSWSKPCTLNSYLNNNYYNSFTDEAKSKIIVHGFNAGSVGGKTLSEIVKEEASNVWIGRVGVMSVSDYVGATMNNGNYIKDIIKQNIWLISSYINSSGYVCNINSNGSVSSSPSNNVSFGILPVVYLSNVNLIGDGKADNPYKIDSNFSGIKEI